MLLSKFHQTIVAFNQICNHHISVIITVNIEHSENSVCLMLRQHRHDTVICSEEQNCRKCDALFIRFRIFKYEPAASEHFFIRHVNPRMVLVIYPRHSPCSIHQVVAKAGNRDSRIYLIHKISALLAGIKVENHVRIICDIDVRLIITVKNSPCIAINGFPNRNIDVKNSTPIYLVFLRSQI